MEEFLIGIFFLVFGGVYAIFPDQYFKVQKYLGKKLMGITYKASPRTFKIYRILGVFFMFIGLVNLLASLV